jgi:hypothetical protein
MKLYVKLLNYQLVTNIKKFNLILLLFFINIETTKASTSYSFDSQTKVIQQSKTKIYIKKNSSIPIDNLLKISNFFTPIDGFSVIIESGQQSGDNIKFDNSLAVQSANIHGTYTANNGVLKFRGETSSENWEQILRTVSFQSNELGCRKITFNAGSMLGLEINERMHYYEYLPIKSTWRQARDSAKLRTHFGMQGYLATITEKPESDFINTKVQGKGWIGASDSESEGASEGWWKWVTGPEAGLYFWHGVANGYPLNEMFNNWRPRAEPNDYKKSGCRACVLEGGEDFALAGWYKDTWNDYPNGHEAIQGYVVEYGGFEQEKISISAIYDVCVVDEIPVEVIQEKHNFLVKDSDEVALKSIIKTKIINKPSDLVFNSINNENNALKEFNGFIKAEILDDSDNLILTLGYIEFDKNSQFLFRNLLLDKAYKKLKIKITALKTGDNYSFIDFDSCGIASECFEKISQQETYISDYFAVRPEKFDIKISQDLVKAGVDFKLNINALDFENHNSENYNETNLTSVYFDFIEAKENCIQEKFNKLNLIDFNNGNFEKNIFYPEVGHLNIKISEKEGYEFAKIDENDTSNELRLITSDEKNISFEPHHFNLESNLTNFKKYDFTYFANELDQMFGEFNSELKALNLQENITKNYDKSCYSEEQNRTFDFNITQNSNHNLVFNTYNSEKNITKSYNYNLENLKINHSFLKEDFNSGVSELNLNLNFTRENNLTLNPVEIKFENQKAIFLYGRVLDLNKKVKGIETDFNPIFEVFLNKNNIIDFAGKSKIEINWFENLEHKNTDQGEIFDIEAFRKNDILLYLNTKKIQYITSEKHGFPFGSSLFIIPSPWLIYDHFNGNAIKNRFKVEFYSDKKKETENKPKDKFSDETENLTFIRDRRIEW